MNSIALLSEFTPSFKPHISTNIAIEHSRNMLGQESKESAFQLKILIRHYFLVFAEYDPYASDLFISELTRSLAGRKMNLNFVEKSQVAQIFIGTLFVPQARSTSRHPHPLVNAFLEAAISSSERKL